jgi:hypothetical protein
MLSVITMPPIIVKEIAITLVMDITAETIMPAIINIPMVREHSLIQEETIIIMVMFIPMLVTDTIIPEQVHTQLQTLETQACLIQLIHLDIREESIITMDIIRIQQALLLTQREVLEPSLIAQIR